MQPKAWLPSGALGSESFGPILERVLKDWSAHWFAGAEASAAPAFQDDWPQPSSASWRSIISAASVSLTPGAQASVAGAMLGVSIPQGSLQPNDRPVVESL